MARGKTIRLEADPHDYRGLIYAMNRMDKAARTALVNDVVKISEWTAKGIVGNYNADPITPKQSAVVALSVRPQRDRMPFVQIGGTRSRTSTGTPAGFLLMGDEFGAIRGFPNGGRRFPWPTPDTRGKSRFGGRWIFPALRAMQPEITRRWKALVWQHIERKWPNG